MNIDINLKCFLKSRPKINPSTTKIIKSRQKPTPNKIRPKTIKPDQNNKTRPNTIKPDQNTIKEDTKQIKAAEIQIKQDQ